MKVRFAVEAAAFRTLLAVGNRIPRRALLSLGSALGALGHLLDRRHRGIAHDNLRLALGEELSAGRRREIVRRCWQHFGRITADTLSFPRFGTEDIGRVVRFEGLDHVRTAYARGRGVLEFSAHFGHWELAALMQGFAGFPLALVARPLDNPALERILADLRSLSGNRIIHKRRAVKEIVKTLQDGLGTAIVIDQDARHRGVFVPFFGRPASTTPTLARLALRTGATVIPNYSLPEPDGSYRIVYEPPVEFDPSRDQEEDVLRLTARCTSIIEGWVRRRPELWLWMHRRWKTTPPEA